MEGSLLPARLGILESYICQLSVSETLLYPSSCQHDNAGKQGAAGHHPGLH